MKFWVFSSKRVKLARTEHFTFCCKAMASTQDHIILRCAFPLISIIYTLLNYQEMGQLLTWYPRVFLVGGFKPFRKY